MTRVEGRVFLSQRGRRCFYAAHVLNSLTKSGAGTIDDLAKRLGVDSIALIESALKRLVSEKYVRLLKKDFGNLYVVNKNLERA